MNDYTVTVKQIEPLDVAYLRGTIPTAEEIPTYLGAKFGKVFGHAGAFEAVQGACIAEYYDEEWSGKNIDVAAAAVINKEIPPSDTVEIRSLAGGTVAFATHHGAYRFLSNAHEAVMSWVHANGYQIDGSGREVYLSGDASGDQQDCVTEVQYFVRKA